MVETEFAVIGGSYAACRLPCNWARGRRDVPSWMPAGAATTGAMPCMTSTG
jgi:hypothetical protein